MFSSVLWRSFPDSNWIHSVWSTGHIKRCGKGAHSNRGARKISRNRWFLVGTWGIRALSISVRSTTKMVWSPAIWFDDPIQRSIVSYWDATWNKRQRSIKTPSTWIPTVKKSRRNLYRLLASILFVLMIYNQVSKKDQSARLKSAIQCLIEKNGDASFCPMISVDPFLQKNPKKKYFGWVLAKRPGAGLIDRLPLLNF